MCRFLAYKGRPVLMDELLYQPKNSLILQSVAAHESEEPLNGDGFGVGWYMQSLSSSPGLFVSVRPAWNERNLRYLADKIQSGCIFAHVRAASLGEVSEANCHPFHYKNFLFMHNGDIEGFSSIKRDLRERLSDDIYNWVRGQTDSEHLFGLFLDCIAKSKTPVSAESMAAAMEETLHIIASLKRARGVLGDSYVNVAITDGTHLIALRYVSSPKAKAPTLYYTHGAKYECHAGICRMTEGLKTEHAVLVVSEKLTTERHQWKEIPQHHFILVEEHLEVSLRRFHDKPKKIKTRPLAKAKILKGAVKRDSKKKRQA